MLHYISRNFGLKFVRLFEKVVVLSYYLDCHGVMTPSSGPPTKIKFLIRRKFSLNCAPTVTEFRNTI